MADHDRDDGSRGEEEAPRDPTPGSSDPTLVNPHQEPPDEPSAQSPSQEPPSGSTDPDPAHVSPAQEPPAESSDPLHQQPEPDPRAQGPSAESSDQPLHEQPGPDPAHAYRVPLGPDPFASSFQEPRTPRDGSLRDFVRQKHAQVIGAGLIGLIVGGVLGGLAVGLVSGMVHRGGDRYPVMWEERGWKGGPEPMCRQHPGGAVECFRERRGEVYPYPYPVPSMFPVPAPTQTLAPKPVPTPTK